MYDEDDFANTCMWSAVNGTNRRFDLGYHVAKFANPIVSSVTQLHIEYRIDQHYEIEILHENVAYNVSMGSNRSRFGMFAKMLARVFGDCISSEARGPLVICASSWMYSIAGSRQHPTLYVCELCQIDLPLSTHHGRLCNLTIFHRAWLVQSLLVV